MSISASPRDLTASHRIADAQPTPTLLFLCSHKATRAGALMRGRLPMLCAACYTAKQAQKVAA